MRRRLQPIKTVILPEKMILRNVAPFLVKLFITATLQMQECKMQIDDKKGDNITEKTAAFSVRRIVPKQRGPEGEGTLQLRLNSTARRAFSEDLSLRLGSHGTKISTL